MTQMNGKRTALLAAAALCSLAAGSVAWGQAAAPPPPPGPVAEAHKAAAVKIAGARYHEAALHQCGGRPGIPAANRAITLAPARVFDNLYYVGLGWVGAWAVNTSDGVVLIDTLNSIKDVEETIVPGLKAYGLDPARVRYVILTHNHADHVSGARYFVDRYKTRVIAAGPEWDLMEKATLRPGQDPPPRRDLTLVDGQTLKVGDTPFTFILTPGHTPASTSIIFPSTDDAGKKHMVALVGGVTAQPTIASQQLAYDGLEHLLAFSKANHVDVELVDHPHVDDSLQLLQTAAVRKKGDPNGFIVGEAGFQSFLGMLRECYLSNIANLEHK
jgi:metallo-beta-lactamase class B